MGFVFVIRKESRDHLLYRSSRIQKWQMFSESDRTGIYKLMESLIPNSETLKLALEDVRRVVDKQKDDVTSGSCLFHSRAT